MESAWVRCILVIILAGIGWTTSWAQLVRNRSFEVVRGSYPQGLWSISTPAVNVDQIQRCLATGNATFDWYIPSASSSDVYNSTVDGGVNAVAPATDALTTGGTRFAGQTPHQGAGYIGLAIQRRETPGVAQAYQYREYIAQRLCTPLTIGKTYRVRYRVACANDAGTSGGQTGREQLTLHSIRNVDLAFLTGDPSDQTFIDYTTDAEPVNGVATQTAVARFVANGALVVPQVRSYDHGLARLNPIPATITQGYDDDVWLEVTYDLVADQAYTHILIGNFDGNVGDAGLSADTRIANPIVDGVYGYMMVDDISIEKLPDASCCAIGPGQLVVDRIALQGEVQTGCCFRVTVTHSTCDACPINGVRIRYLDANNLEQFTAVAEFTSPVLVGQTKSVNICIEGSLPEQEAEFQFINENGVVTCSTTKSIACVDCSCEQMSDPDYLEFTWQARANDQGNQIVEGCLYDLLATNKKCREPLRINNFSVQRNGAAEYDHHDDLNMSQPSPNTDMYVANPGALLLRGGCPTELATYFVLYGGQGAMDIRNIQLQNGDMPPLLCFVPGPIVNNAECPECTFTIGQNVYGYNYIQACTMFANEALLPPGGDETPGFPPFNSTIQDPFEPPAGGTEDCCCCQYYTADLIADLTTSPREYRVIVGHDEETYPNNANTWEQIPEKCRVYMIELSYAAYADRGGNLGMGLVNREFTLSKREEECNTLVRFPLPSKNFVYDYASVPNELHVAAPAPGDYVKAAYVSRSQVDRVDGTQWVYNRYMTYPATMTPAQQEAAQQQAWDNAVGPWVNSTGDLVVRPIDICKDPNIDESTVRVSLYNRNGVQPVCEFRGTIRLQNFLAANPCQQWVPITMNPTSVEDQTVPTESTMNELDLSAGVVDDVIRVVLQPAPRNGSYRVSTLEGRVVREGTLPGAEFTIDVSGLPQGVYLVNVSSGSYSRSKSVVLTR